MKIYLATSAPGTEASKERPLILDIVRRLLSYHHIVAKQFACQKIFDSIRRHHGSE